MQNEVPPGVMLMMSLRMSVCMHMSAPVWDCVRANLCCHYCCAVLMILAWHMVFLLCNIMINTRILKPQEHCVRMTKRCCHVATVEVILVALINPVRKRRGNFPQKKWQFKPFHFLWNFRQLQISAERNSLNLNFQKSFQVIKGTSRLLTMVNTASLNRNPLLYRTRVGFQ